MLLTNCHLLKSGLVSHPCDDDEDVQECTQRIGRSMVSFQTYNSFFTHADNICFYIQSQNFTANTERAVNHLYIAVSDTATHLSSFHAAALTSAARLGDLIRQQQDVWSEGLDKLTKEQQRKFEELEDTTNALHRQVGPARLVFSAFRFR